MARFARLQVDALAKSVFTVAHGDVLGTACGGDRVPRVLGFCVETAAGVGTVSAVGGADGGKIGLC